MFNVVPSWKREAESDCIVRSGRFKRVCGTGRRRNHEACLISVRRVALLPAFVCAHDSRTGPVSDLDERFEVSTDGASLTYTSGGTTI